MKAMSRKKNKDSPNETPPSAFGALDQLGDLPPGPEVSAPGAPIKTSKRGQKKTNRGRVDIIRQTAHRGGKGVTVAKNFMGIALRKSKSWRRRSRKPVVSVAP